MDDMTRADYLDKISQTSHMGRMDNVIDIALQVRNRYPGEIVFEKLLADLYFQNQHYELAGASYIQLLKKAGNRKQYMNYFAHFLQEYANAVEGKMLADYCMEVEKCMDRGEIGKTLLPALCEILSRYMEFPEVKLFQNDNKFNAAVEYLRGLEKRWRIYILDYKVLSLEHSPKNKCIDKYVVSSMEKREQYREALQLIEKVLDYDKDRVAVRTLFRICRKLDDYTSAETYILKHSEVKKQGEFNILYELVFYYSKIGDADARSETLGKIEKCGYNSIPIMRTLRNFYLQFGMLAKAVDVTNRISALEQQGQKPKDDRQELEETAARALLDTVREMSEELEHSRNLISMSELLKGFSHELGQPITNIRYGIQLYQMKMERGVGTEIELKELFEDILSQTFRIRNLLARFSPVVNGKESMTEFNAAEEMEKVLKEFAARLEKENIKWTMDKKAEIILYGDRVKFHQIFYNLIGNSIYALKEKNTKGCIKIRLEKVKRSYRITFEDNGTGVPAEYRDKIFKPFFTTKERSADETGGGEGLGLYIVWNIVRMFDGNIKIDKQFEKGARFIIELPKKKV